MKKIKIYPVKYQDIEVYRWQIEKGKNESLDAARQRVESDSQINPYPTLLTIENNFRKASLYSYKHFLTFSEQNYFDDLIKYLRLANQCNHIAQQGRILPQGVTQTFTLDNVNYTLSGTDPSTWPYRDEYAQQLSLALVMRDAACVNTLMSYTPDISSAVRSPAQGAYIEYMHSVIREDVDHMAVHNKVMPLIEEVIPYSHHWELDLWHALGKLQQDRDLAAFELVVVESFTQYMQKQKKDRQRPSLYMPFLLLAPVCMAYDKFAYRPQHHNEYLPEWLISGHFDLPA